MVQVDVPYNGTGDVDDGEAEIYDGGDHPQAARSGCADRPGPDGVAQATKLREWLDKLGTKTLYIAPGSPWGNGYCESFNGKLRNELLNGEIFYTLREAQVLIEQWRQHYNRVRPHSALGYRLPAPEARGLALVPRKTVRHQRAA